MMSTLAKKLLTIKQQHEQKLVEPEVPLEVIEQEPLHRRSTQKKLTDIFLVKKKRDRFNGLSEADVMAKLLPDHLDYGLDIIIIGYNPGLNAAHVGHHYAGPGNHFWKCLFLSGITPQQMNAFDDHKLKNFGIGFTNIVSRTTRGSADLTRTEIKEGAKTLSAKVQHYRPKIAVFNGKGIYEVFCGHKNFFFGKQPDPFPGTNTLVFVMPSSSARCSQLPRAVDKVPFYVALRKLRDHLSGTLPQLDESEVVFANLELKVEPKREPNHSEVAMQREQPKRRRQEKSITTVESTLATTIDSWSWQSGQEMMKPSCFGSGVIDIGSNAAMGFNNSAGRYFSQNESLPLPFGVTPAGIYCSYGSPIPSLRHSSSSSSVLDYDMALPRIPDTVKSEVLQDMSVYGTMSFAYSNYGYPAQFTS